APPPRDRGAGGEGAGLKRFEVRGANEEFRRLLTSSFEPRTSNLSATLRDRFTVNQQSQYVLSGLRPTGRVHLGNYFGAVRNWIELQDRYRCFYFVADWHALT